MNYNLDPNDISSDITSLSEAIFKFGVSSVIIATGIVIFVIAIIVMVKNNNKQSKELADSNKELMKSMLEQNERMINFMMEKSNNNHTSKDNTTEPRLVDAYIDVSISLKSICKSMLAKLQCSKVSIYVFHNGDASNYGLPFFKMSCIGEWSIHGNSFNRVKTKSNFPLYVFDEMVQSLYNNKEYIMSDVNSLNKDSNIFDLIHSSTKSFVAFAISDDENNKAGFTLIEFENVHNFENPKELNEIRCVVEDNNDTISDIIIDSELPRKIRANDD